MSKFNECVKQLEVKYSVRDAARNLKMHYSQLHSLLSSKKKPHGQALSQCAKKNVIKCYLGNKISQQLPYKRLKKNAFLTHLVSCCIQNTCQRTNQTRFQGPIPKLSLQMPETKILCLKKNTFQRHSMC